MSSIEIKRVVSWSVVTYHYISSDPLHELIPNFNDIAHVKVGTSDTSDLLKKWQLLLPSISPIDFMTIILLQFFTNDSVSRRIIFLLFVFIVFYCGRCPLILHWWRILWRRSYLVICYDTDFNPSKNGFEAHREMNSLYLDEDWKNLSTFPF